MHVVIESRGVTNYHPGEDFIEEWQRKEQQGTTVYDFRLVFKVEFLFNFNKSLPFRQALNIWRSWTQLSAVPAHCVYL